jgi:hypothetical protein
MKYGGSKQAFLIIVLLDTSCPEIAFDVGDYLTLGTKIISSHHLNSKKADTEEFTLRLNT